MYVHLTREKEIKKMIKDQQDFISPFQKAREFLLCFSNKSLQLFTSTFHKSTYIEAQNKMSLVFDIKN
jgi:hypothetical protein